MITLHGNLPLPKKQYMAWGVGDLTFTGLLFSWFLLTGRRMDQGLELQLNAVQNFGQVIVQAQG